MCFTKENSINTGNNNIESTFYLPTEFKNQQIVKFCPKKA